MKVSPEAEAAIDKEILALVESGRIKKLDEKGKERALRVLPVFAVPQNEKWRMVWDGRELSELRTTRFQSMV